MRILGHAAQAQPGAVGKYYGPRPDGASLREPGAGKRRVMA